MGMVLSMEENEDPWWRTRSRSWECSRSIEDIASGVDCTAAVQQVVWNLCGAIDRLAQVTGPSAGQAWAESNEKCRHGTGEVRANDQAGRRSSAWV
jgi:hypothetical protein